MNHWQDDFDFLVAYRSSWLRVRRKTGNLRAVEAVRSSLCEECNKKSNRKRGKNCWVTLKHYYYDGPITYQTLS